MQVLVINGSPAGKNSITLQTVLYIQKHFPEVSFRILDAGQKIKSIEKDFSECRKLLSEADLLLFCYPVYTFLVPAQLHRFIELIKEHNINLSGKYATQLTTSKHFYDTTAHQFIQDNCEDLGLRYIRGLSADMEDLLHEKGRNEALSFFRYILWSMDKRRTGMSSASLVIVTDTDFSVDSGLNRMISYFQECAENKAVIVNLADFPFSGGCLGCFNCASEGKCIYKDGFDQFLREHIQSSDAIIYAFTVKDHSMGYRFKLYDDRQFCNGHRTVTMGRPVSYLVSGNLDKEPNLRTVIEARAQVGGNFLAGIATDQTDPENEITDLLNTLSYAIENNYQPPKNFYGVGGLKIFRDLIYQMQGLMREDHRFYKKHGFYDFPQKHKAKIAAMYLVGGMMRNKVLSKKAGNKMTQGMLMPYQKVLKKSSS